VEDDVFVGPGVTTTNDSTMSRHAPQMPIIGCRLRRACRVGGGVTICPDIEVGEEAFVAAGAVVTKHVPPRAVVMGVPAGSSARSPTRPARALALTGGGVATAERPVTGR
jgi:acetyltransferase-like isoleucine patch superfamily enzyme